MLVIIIVSDEDQSHDLELFLQDFTYFLKHKIILLKKVCYHLQQRFQVEEKEKTYIYN